MYAPWQDHFPSVIAVANNHYARGRFARAQWGYELAARLCRNVGAYDTETAMLNAAFLSQAKAEGRAVKETWS